METTLLNSLPDRILLSIFYSLPFLDLVRLERVDRRLNTLLRRRFWTTKGRVIKWGGPLLPNWWRETSYMVTTISPSDFLARLFERCGPCVRELNLELLYHDTEPWHRFLCRREMFFRLEFAHTFARLINLEELNLTQVKISSGEELLAMGRIFGGTLRRLNIRSCLNLVDIDENGELLEPDTPKLCPGQWSAFLALCPKLEELDISFSMSQFYHVSFKTISPQLRSFKGDISAAALLELMHRCAANLETVNIMFMKGMSAKNVDLVFKSFRRIKHLCFCAPDWGEEGQKLRDRAISQMDIAHNISHTLESLIAWLPSIPVNENFTRLTTVLVYGPSEKHHLKRLSYLRALRSLWLFSSDIEDEVLELIAKRCAFLEEVNLYHCQRASSNGLRHFIQHCRRVRMFAGDHLLTNDLLEEVGEMMYERIARQSEVVVKSEAINQQHNSVIGDEHGLPPIAYLFTQEIGMYGRRAPLDEREGRLFYFLRRPTDPNARIDRDGWELEEFWRHKCENLHPWIVFCTGVRGSAEHYYHNRTSD